MKEDSILERGLRELNVSFSSKDLELIEFFLGELSFWNRKINLVRSQGDDLIREHILDSLSALPVIKSLSYNKIADIGSGGGFPAIPLSIFLGESSITLIERSGKKASFLCNVKALLRLNHVQVTAKPLNEITDSFDLVTLRAFGKLEDVIGELLRITAPGGNILVYKGRREFAEKEIEAVRDFVSDAVIVPVRVPFLNKERNLVIIKPKLLL